MSPWLPAALAAAAILLAALIVQFALPRIAARRIARGLTARGGEARVSIYAFPATRLLRDGGDALIVRGRRLEIGMGRDGGGLSVLDGFERVDIALGEFRTGPFEVTSFELVRERGGPYVMRSQALTSGAALAAYGGEQFGGVAPLLGTVARSAPLGGRSFTVELEVELESETGLLSVSSGGGTVAGYPAGPIATMIASAVARRLEISY